MIFFFCFSLNGNIFLAADSRFTWTHRVLRGRKCSDKCVCLCVDYGHNINRNQLKNLLVKTISFRADFNSFYLTSKMKTLEAISLSKHILHQNEEYFTDGAEREWMNVSSPAAYLGTFHFSAHWRKTFTQPVLDHFLYPNDETEERHSTINHLASVLNIRILCMPFHF